MNQDTKPQDDEESSFNPEKLISQIDSQLGYTNEDIKIDNVKFKKEAMPALELIMTAKIESFTRGIIKGNICTLVFLY